MFSRKLVTWLMAGDPAVAWATARDLLGQDRPDLRARIAKEGWGRAILAARNADGTWGNGFYRPKWTSSHYTLLELRRLGLPPDTPEARDSVKMILAQNIARDGGVDHESGKAASDVCVTGMFLNYASYFGIDEARLRPMVDMLLSQRMGDGGYNCRSNRSGARHSSLHSTLSVLEGFWEYRCAGHGYRGEEIDISMHAAREFILLHRLYRSDRTGDVIDRRFLRFPISPRWYYSVLRALDHFRAAGVSHDPRMNDALGEIRAQRKSDGRWRPGAAHSGAVHLTLEPARQPSRLITLAALRVLAAYA